MMVQSKLNVPKNQYNSFGKYKYRSCEDILEEVKPLLSEVKATLTISDEIQLIGDRYYVMAVARFTDIEEEKSIVVTAYAREEDNKKGMDSSQLTGSTSSYARKYALNGLFCIDDTKDSDTTNVGQTKSTQSTSQAKNNIKAQTINQAKINTIKKELDRTGVGEKPILQRYKIDKLESITEELYLKVFSALKATPSKEDKQ